jgi:hypothetical protein
MNVLGKSEECDLGKKFIPVTSPLVKKKNWRSKHLELDEVP